MTSPHHFAVIGNPINHSRSPEIHTAFARQHNINLSYERVFAPINGFITCVDELRAVNFRGVNVTVPFKLEAFAYAGTHSSAAQWAGAANTLVFGSQGESSKTVFADNTDGAGLVCDLTQNLNMSLTGKHICLLGAGGAARGVLQALLLQKPASVVVKNRSLDKALAWLADVQKTKDFAEILGGTQLSVCAWSDDNRATYDVVINATSSGLGEGFVFPMGIQFSAQALAYDMMYGKVTPFLQWALDRGVRTADGWGMLVEQAAKSFEIWHGILPNTSDLIAHSPSKVL